MSHKSHIEGEWDGLPKTDASVCFFFREKLLAFVGRRAHVVTAICPILWIFVMLLSLQIWVARVL